MLFLLKTFTHNTQSVTTNSNPRLRKSQSWKRFFRIIFFAENFQTLTFQFRHLRARQQITIMLSFLKLVTKKIFYKTKLLSKKYSHFKNDIEVHSKWYGNHYGGFFVAPQYLSKRSKIYSFGIGEDLSFELSLSKEFGCSFKCFDPTPKSIHWINRIKPTLTGNLEIFDYGLAKHTSVSSFFSLRMTSMYQEVLYLNKMQINPRK